MLQVREESEQAMSGYCPDCGNTLCVCNWKADIPKPEAPTRTYDMRGVQAPTAYKHVPLTTDATLTKPAKAQAPREWKQPAHVFEHEGKLVVELCNAANGKPLYLEAKHAAYEALERENKELKLDAYDYGMKLLEDKLAQARAELAEAKLLLNSVEFHESIAEVAVRKERAKSAALVEQVKDLENRVAYYKERSRP